MLLAFLLHLHMLLLPVFPHLHPFLNFLGPFNNLNERCISFIEAVISLFHHQNSLCLLIPRFPTDLNSFFNQTFLEILLHLFDTSRLLHHQCCPGLHSLYENTCSYIIFQLPNLASFHKFHFTPIQPFPQIQNTNDQFVIWNTLLLPNHISNQFSLTLSDNNVTNHSPAFISLICNQSTLIFLNQVFATTKFKASAISSIISPSTFLIPNPNPICIPYNKYL